MRKIIDIIPVAKPRMTVRDKWKKRPCVMRYRAFADELRAKVGPVPENASIVHWAAFMPMPKSWTKKKKLGMLGKPHRQKPDKDNIEKAILDALFKEDSGIYGGSGYKHWDDGTGPRIILVIE